ncbi:MAG: 30S ribosomal protein S1 [Desulfobacteraceae bacterium]|nr:30S ribosomal protein S1 [Desulfobacteraceae bacterium]MBC2757913.1 30S ribosomal protein S1 [Desulfobacteraceae bacterium]
MPDDVFESDTNNEENFADLFESYMTEQNDIQVGDKIKGEIIAVGDKNIFINTGTKTDGVVEKNELLNEKKELECKTGDVLDLYVVSISDGEIRLSKSISGAGGDRLLYDAYKNRIPVEGRVTETCKGGFRISIMKKTAFCPISQIDTRYVENQDEYVGASFDFLISKFEERGRNIVVSRRELLKQEQEAAKKEFFKSAKAEDIVDATVNTIKPYGVFVEIVPGVEGLIHISELSWSRIGHPDEILKINDPIRAKILDINPETFKISMSAKQATSSPWETVHQQFKTGDKTDGKVTRCADFGAFVEIAPGIEGLVHVSEMSYLKRVHRAEDIVSPGDVVAVTIKEVDSINKRISLSMKDAEGDPWINIDKKYSIGKIYSGRIEKKESFGYFINLEPGIVGLLPKSKINSAPNASEIEKQKIDDIIAVKVEEIHTTNRKITLGIEGSGDDWKKFAPEHKPPSSGTLGDLGEKLQSALKSKK